MRPHLGILPVRKRLYLHGILPNASLHVNLTSSHLPQWKTYLGPVGYDLLTVLDDYLELRLHL